MRSKAHAFKVSTQENGASDAYTNRGRGLRRGNDGLVGRALVVVRCVEWPTLVVAGGADITQPELVFVGRVECFGPAVDGLGSHLRCTA